MKRLLTRIFKFTGIVLILIMVVMISIIALSGPKLPSDAGDVIASVRQSELPELLQGQTGHVHSGETRIWYESIPPTAPSKGTILLFMGISNDALGWPPSFLTSLVNSGYQVIRYDYRGTGLSDWDNDFEQNPYSLADLALDAVAILDKENIDQAHIVGISMGGMVAQEFAIRHPHRTLTLNLMMSSGNIMDEELPSIAQDITLALIIASGKYGIFPTESNTIKLHIASRMILRGDADYSIDVQETAQQVLYNLRNRNGYNSQASQQHQGAVFRSGSRYEALKTLELPTLIIHGINDPFIPIEHSEKLATTIPNSRTRWFENMGHDLPPDLFDSLTRELILNFERNPG